MICDGAVRDLLAEETDRAKFSRNPRKNQRDSAEEIGENDGSGRKRMDLSRAGDLVWDSEVALT